MKKLLSVLLSLTMVLALLPMEIVSASTDLADGDYTYSVADGVATIIQYIGEGGNVEIPSTLGGYPVTRIGEWAFENCLNVTSITIPDSVTSIGEHAFFECNSLSMVHITDLAAWCGIDFYDGVSNPIFYAEKFSLNGMLVTDLVIPQGVTAVEDFSFYYCTGLTSVTIPDSVISIGEDAFSLCIGLTSINLPNSITHIGDSAFWYCKNMTSVVIPDSVTSIGDMAFNQCPHVKLIVYGESGKRYAIRNGHAYVDKTPYIVSVAVTQKPTKTRYLQGDSLNTKGLQVTAVYSNGTKTVLSSGFTATADLSKAGRRVVTVTYGGKSATYTLTVTALATPKVKAAIVTKGIKVSWSKVSGADKYIVQRRAGSGRWSTVKTTTSTSYTDTKAAYGKDYAYRVKAVNGSAAKVSKATAALRRLKATPSVKLSKAKTGFKVTWKKVSGAKQYEVHRKVADGSWKKVKTTKLAVYTDKSATKGKYYTYRVRAIYGSSKGAYKASKKMKR